MKTSERHGLSVEVTQLTRTYRLPFGEPVEALAAVDAAFAPGVLSVIAGPSGSGKSTLLRQIALIERPSSGTVLLDGRETASLTNGARRRLRGREISYVFQRPTDNLIAGLRSVDQLHLAARLAGAPRPDAEAILELLGLAEHGLSNPMRLSGGQQQRLALATALAARSSLILADEPTAQLDRASSLSVISALQRLAAEGPTVVVCSHDDEMIDAGTHVVLLASGRVMEGVR